ncbi:peptidoglycan DD-metalloendopeptidase family protein [Staphylococcus epidermidis]|nr:peptidoglycan DD-metalloendopeptidase family protein [Staphylococcus epidermidis]
MNFIWPASGSLIAGFDEARNKGYDIAGKAGDPVVAAADGRVVYAGAGLRGYGNLIILKHNKHLSDGLCPQPVAGQGRSIGEKGPEDCRDGAHRRRPRQLH